MRTPHPTRTITGLYGILSQTEASSACIAVVHENTVPCPTIAPISISNERIARTYRAGYAATRDNLASLEAQFVFFTELIKIPPSSHRRAAAEVCTFSPAISITSAESRVRRRQNRPIP